MDLLLITLLTRIQSEQRVSLRLQRPFGGTLLLALAILALLFGGLEVIARVASARGVIPFQAYGTNHIQFELQVQNLQRFVAQNGPPDCFILGNSQALRGIDPQVFNRVYLDQSGQAITCYNFSVVGTNISTTLYFSQILLQEYRPRLLVVGTNFLDFSESREARVDPRFEENEWIAYQLGRPSLKGWLVEHSYAYRLLHYASYGAADGLHLQAVRRELRQWQPSLSEYGYGRSSTTIDPSEAMKPGFVKNFLEQFGGYTLSQWNLDSLEQIGRRAREQGSRLVIVEMPYHASLLELDPTLRPFIAQVNAALATIAANNGATFLQGSPAEGLPESGWHDRYHLNSESSPSFSAWLAEQIAGGVILPQPTPTP